MLKTTFLKPIIYSKFWSTSPFRSTVLEVRNVRGVHSTSVLGSSKTPDINPGPPLNIPKNTTPCPRPTRSENWTTRIKATQLMEVEGKVAIIAGGCTGVCLATAAELLHQNAKCVVLTGREPPDGIDALNFLKRDFGPERAAAAEFVPLDVTNSQQFEEVFRRTLHKHHRVDILFNVAFMMDDSRWEYEVDTNINGLVRGVLFAFRYMGRRNNGLPSLKALSRPPDPAAAASTDTPVVVNMACVVGLDPLAGAPVYSLTQAAAVSLTRCFGAPFHNDRSGVRVVGLYTGITAEDALLDDDQHLRQRLLDWEWSGAAQAQLKKMPVQETRAAAQAALFLARYGPSSSVWVVEGGELARLKFPRHQDVCQRTATFT